jgi:putative transposase
VRTWEGWLYLATVLDVFSRRVIGWALAEHLRAELVCTALRIWRAPRAAATSRA